MPYLHIIAYLWNSFFEAMQTNLLKHKMLASTFDLWNNTLIVKNCSCAFDRLLSVVFQPFDFKVNHNYILK